ncbi:MAG TPA: ABC transporter ATP-binding protein [Solirubrobacteraceae bacterium]|nr:ABC transporter ATP-binding protein [Solirubrobacteraceae bacterium]
MTAPSLAPAPAPPSRAGDARLTLVTPAEPDQTARPCRAAAVRPLTLRAITKRWRAGQNPVLDDVELMLEPGTSTWVGGRNGVGKTTLLRIAAGLIHPEHGSVEARGITVHQDRQRYQRLVSFLPAGDRGLYARLTVEQHLNFWARIAMVPPARLRRSVGDAIDSFQLAELRCRRVDRLSMGQRQRLRIAMTFLPEPDVVLLDEPLTSLDSDGAELLAQATTRVQARDGAVLWCSPEAAPPDHGFDVSWTLQDARLVRT